MGTKENPGEFDCYANALPDEPMFVLLARDELAPSVVATWAARYRHQKEQMNGGLMTPTHQKKHDEALHCALKMGEWRARNPGPYKVSATPRDVPATPHRYLVMVPQYGRDSITGYIVIQATNDPSDAAETMLAPGMQQQRAVIYRLADPRAVEFPAKIGDGGTGYVPASDPAPPHDVPAEFHPIVGAAIDRIQEVCSISSPMGLTDAEHAMLYKTGRRILWTSSDKPGPFVAYLSAVPENEWAVQAIRDLRQRHSFPAIDPDMVYSVTPKDVFDVRADAPNALTPEGVTNEDQAQRRARDLKVKQIREVAREGAIVDVLNKWPDGPESPAELIAELDLIYSIHPIPMRDDRLPREGETAKYVLANQEPQHDPLGDALKLLQSMIKDQPTLHDRYTMAVIAGLCAHPERALATPEATVRLARQMATLALTPK